MLEHIVLFNLKDGVDSSQAKKIYESISALQGKVPGIVFVNYGDNINYKKETKKYSHSVIVSFLNEKSRDAYFDNPLRKKIAEEIFNPLVSDVLIFDQERSFLPYQKSQSI